jgi:hypothetical protein
MIWLLHIHAVLAASCNYWQSNKYRGPAESQRLPLKLFSDALMFTIY